MFNKKEYDRKYYYKNKKTHSIRVEKYQKIHKEKLKKQKMKYNFLNREKINLHNKKAALKLRKEVIKAYGSKCKCCKEKELDFLTIDHINNDGKSHRKIVKCGAFYKWLKKNNFPEGFQILCWNCNRSKFNNKGICIHKLKKK